MSHECGNCHRERDDVFWHAADQAWYCEDVWRCEMRFCTRNARGDFDHGWQDAEKSGAHVSPMARMDHRGGVRA